MNLHLAVGGEESVVNFYESVDSGSMASKQSKDKMGESFVGSVHSLQLGEICKRYFLVRPNFMNMAVEGLSY